MGNVFLSGGVQVAVSGSGRDAVITVGKDEMALDLYEAISLRANLDKFIVANDMLLNRRKQLTFTHGYIIIYPSLRETQIRNTYVK